MKLNTFSVKGLLAFGDECAVDLRAVPPGLIAIVGRNGQGKTTIAETPLAALYRVLPSRDHELVDYAHGKDSSLQATFDTPRGGYRARVNLNGDRRTSEAVLVHTDAGGVETILNDGKLTTFDAAVASVFPPVETLLASSFSAQNRAGSFSTLDKKGRKALFASLLGLDHYEQMATTARTCAANLDRSIDVTRARREAVAREAAPTRQEQIEMELGQVQARRQQFLASIAGGAREVANLDAQAAAAKEQYDRWLVASAAVAPLEQRIRALTMELTTLDQRAERAQSDHRVDGAEADRQHAAKLADIDARVAKNNGLLARADEIRAAVAETAGLTERRARLVAAGDVANESITRLQDDLTKAQGRVRDLETAERDLARLTEQAETLVTVPCAGAGAYASCRFLALARAAQAELPAVTTLVAQKPAAESNVVGTALALRIARDGKANTETERHATDTRLSELSPTVALGGHLDAAVDRIEELTASRDAADAARAQALADAQARLEAVLDDVYASVAAATKERETVQASLADLYITMQADAGAQAEVARIDRQLAAVRAQASDDKAQIAALDTTDTHLRAAQRACLDAQAALVVLDDTLRQMETDLLEWQFLAKALARDGLPTLEIAAAGPTVSQYANSLLEACFGPRFSLDLVTQQGKADGKGLKEVFELRVLDNEKGGDARDLTDLSGGEQVIVDEALKNALTLFMSTRSTSMPVRTIIRDETTGALDADNAPRYVAMLRKLADIGGYHHILFVTHSAAAAAGADAQIVVHDGQADIQLAPFPEAA